MQSSTLVTEVRNQRIVLARLLCIFGMIYVHVPLLDNKLLSGTGNGFFDFEFLRAFVVEGYGRASACLLSVVSGYLAARTLSANRVSIKHFYLRRFKSIYVPMLLWGLLTVLIFSIASISQTTFLHDVCGWDRTRFVSCSNVVFHLTGMGQGPTMHLAFLRDLFVCMLLAPILVLLLKRVPVLILAGLFVLYILDFESVIVLRPLVIFGFGIGIFIGLNRLKTDLVDNLWLLWAALSILITLLIIAFNQGQLPGLQSAFSEYSLDAKESLLYPISRLFGALTIWAVTAKLVNNTFFRISRLLEPCLFVAFCAHPLVLSIIQSAAEDVLSYSAAARLYPFWFILAPAVTLLIALTCTVICSLYSPTLWLKVTGGRGGVTPDGSRVKTEILSAGVR